MLLPAAAAAKAPVHVGSRAPNFELRDMQRALWQLAERNRGRVLVLDFFRTDCAPCRKSLPVLRQLQRKLAKQRVEIVMIALLEEKAGEAKLQRFLAQRKLPYRVLVDSYGVAAGKYIREGRTYRLPALFVIDRTGRIRVHHQGLLSDAGELARRITTLASARAATPH